MPSIVSLLLKPNCESNFDNVVEGSLPLEGVELSTGVSSTVIVSLVTSLGRASGVTEDVDIIELVTVYDFGTPDTLNSIVKLIAFLASSVLCFSNS